MGLLFVFDVSVKIFLLVMVLIPLYVIFRKDLMLEFKFFTVVSFLMWGAFGFNVISFSNEYIELVVLFLTVLGFNSYLVSLFSSSLKCKLLVYFPLIFVIGIVILNSRFHDVYFDFLGGQYKLINFYW